MIILQRTSRFFISSVFCLMSCACQNPVNSNDSSILWRTEIASGSLIFADAPIFEDKNIVVFAGIKTQSVLFGIDKTTGSIKWEWSDWLNQRENVLMTGAHISNNILVLQNGENSYGINLETGKTLWRFQHQGTARIVSGLGATYFFTPTPINVAQGITTTGNSTDIFSIPQLSGYRVSIRTPVPFIAQNGDTLLVITSGGIRLSDASAAPTHLLLYNLSRRAIVYDSIQVENSVWGLPIIKDNKIYLSIGLSIQCNDLWTGKPLWRTEFPSNFLFSGIIVADGKVFGACEDTNLYGLDAETGRILWKQPIAGTTRRPFYMNGLVYISKGKLYAVDATTGEILWNRECPEQAQNSSVYFFGYVTGSEGKIYCQSYKSAYCYKAAR
jgi:outer membrane protein assembly factor BamB